MNICSALRARLNPFLILVGASAVLIAGSALAASKTATYEGKAVRIGRGTAHTVVRTDANGKLSSISVVFTPGILDGLPKADKGTDPDFPYLLAMPKNGPKTVVDHVVINWESAGHPPPKVYDVPHFDFHFYLVSYEEQMKVAFKDLKDSGDPSQQPVAELLPAGYVVPPGTAVSRMGVHGIDPAAHEFHNHPFDATFIYGYHNKQQTFIEPMVSLAFLKSKPSFSAPVTRPVTYTKPGAYPSAYSVKYDTATNRYDVMLSDFK